VHRLSARRAHAFVKCNCAAIPTGLLESELFGHEKGSFTSAVAQRIGRFELANHGTIFLDEVGEAPLELQPKLLRVLQEREFERVGSSHTQRTDARVVAATNVNLPQMVGSKRFRADLYYRLNVFPVEVPPLRERPEDIPVLVRHFAREAARRMNRKVTWIASTAMDALIANAWPGNIRELQNFVERSVIRSAGDELQVPVSELEDGIITAAPRSSAGTLKDAERAHILAILKETRWVLSGPRGAAMRLGINRSTLQFRMRKLGIERPMGEDAPR
jgi:formate hydrogenlyase transcriptional activator